MDVRYLARLGAEMRLGELRLRIAGLTTEMNAIYGAFPELRKSKAFGYVVHGDLLSGVRGEAVGGTLVGIGRRKKRKPMTAAQRKAVGIG